MFAFSVAFLPPISFHSFFERQRPRQIAPSESNHSHQPNAFTHTHARIYTFTSHHSHHTRIDRLKYVSYPFRSLVVATLLLVPRRTMSSDLPMPSDSNQSNQSTIHATSSSPSPPSSSSSNNTPATAAAAAASTTISSSSSAPQPSPSPNPGDEAEEDELINNDADGDNFDEDDVTDSKPTPRKRSNAAPPAPGEALQRLNELLQRTEQFAKFVPTKAENKKASDNRLNTRGARREKGFERREREE